MPPWLLSGGEVVVVLVVSVADGTLNDVEKIAERLAGWCAPR